MSIWNEFNVFLALLVDWVNWGRGECSVTLVRPARGGVEPRKGWLGGPFKMLPKIGKGGVGHQATPSITLRIRIRPNYTRRKETRNALKLGHNSCT